LEDAVDSDEPDLLAKESDVDRANSGPERFWEKVKFKRFTGRAAMVLRRYLNACVPEIDDVAGRVREDVRRRWNRLFATGRVSDEIRDAHVDETVSASGHSEAEERGGVFGDYTRATARASWGIYYTVDRARPR